MIFLYSTISSSKSIFVIQIALLILGHLHRSLDASGLADCSFLLHCVSPRTSPCLGRSPLVALPAVGFTLLLPAVGFCSCLCLLLASLFSVLFIISPLLDVERCSASASSLRCSSRCPCTVLLLYLLFHHWLVGRGSVSDSHHLILGSGSVSDPLQRTLCASLQLPGCLACTSNTTTRQLCPS